MAEALQWAGLSGRQQRNLSSQMRRLGRAKSDVSAQRQRLETAAVNPEAKESSRDKASRRLLSQAALAPTFVNEPITHEGAAGRRYDLTMAGAERSRQEGVPSGQDWYFQHNRKLGEVAEETGHDKRRIITASAVMSPQNNPEQELAAVTSLAKMHADPQARITVPQEALTEDAPAGLNDWVGRSVHPSKLNSEQLAHLSTTSLQPHVETRGDVDLGSVAKGGVKGNVVKAISVLRGETNQETAIDPATSPKVWSYHKNIQEAQYGSPEHTEFGSRMHQATGDEAPGQTRMDLFGLAGATHGILSPTGHTAEDTWQQAISTGQQLASVDIAGRGGRAARQSPAKFSVGEGGSANQKLLRTRGQPGEQSALMHAWQNHATQMAAARLSQTSGEIIPTVGIQAGGWTEARRQAGKNIEEMSPAAKPVANRERQGALVGSDFSPTREATVTPHQMRRHAEGALSANLSTAAQFKGSRRKADIQKRQTALSGASRQREFLSGGQMGLDLGGA